MMRGIIGGTQRRPVGDFVDPLERRVEALEQQVVSLNRDAGERTALLEDVLRYLSTQGKAAESMLFTFDESEEQGFTAGINFTSRETLLAGLRRGYRFAGSD